VLALGLAGCVAYAPAPPNPGRFVSDYDARRMEKTTPWTGGELLAAAIDRNPQVVEARAKYAVAVAAAKAARARPGSTLTLTAEYADEAPHWGYTGGLDIPLDYGARRGVRITTANLQALQAFYDYGETVWSVRSDLERARIDLVAARTESELAGEASNVRAERLQRLNRRVIEGQDPRSVAITAQGEAQAASQRLAAARGRLASAEAELGKALGVQSANAPGSIEPVTSAPPLDNLVRWRTEAALSRRDVLRAVADYDIAENALRLEVANQYPQLSLGPAYNYDHGVTKLPFSLSLALPPADLNRHAIAQADAARAAAGRSLELAVANVLAGVDAARASLAAARQAVGGAAADLDLAIRSETAAKLALDAGQSDRTDALAAQAARLEAQLNLLDAQHAYALATVDLEDALRRAFDPAETATIEAALIKLKAEK
jgi:CRISPR system Cascade subunit CasA